MENILFFIIGTLLGMILQSEYQRHLERTSRREMNNFILEMGKMKDLLKEEIKYPDSLQAKQMNK